MKTSLKNLWSVVCVEVAPCRHMGQVSGSFGVGWWGGNHTSAKQPSFPSEISIMLTKMILNLWDASVPDVLYTFLVTTITCLTSEQQPWLDGGIFSNVPCQHKMTYGGYFVKQPMMQKSTQQFTVTLKMRKNRLWQLKAIKWNKISPCLRKIHCDIWNALFFTNVIDHWL